MASATLLLPLASRFAGQPLPPTLAKVLAQADRESGEPGDRGQLRRHFQLIPDHWPVAALTRRQYRSWWLSFTTNWYTTRNSSALEL